MRLNKPNHVRPDRLPVVGYFNRRTGQAICVAHGPRDTESPASPWKLIRVGDRWEHAGETAPIRCHDCGAWLEGDGES